METSKRLSELDPRDRLLVGKVFGHDLSGAGDAVIILRTTETETVDGTIDESDGVPTWCNVLEGLSDEDLREVVATFDEPVRLIS